MIDKFNYIHILQTYESIGIPNTGSYQEEVKKYGVQICGEYHQSKIQYLVTKELQLVQVIPFHTFISIMKNFWRVNHLKWYF